MTAVTFTGSSGMTSAMESMTNSDDEVIAQQADSYAQAYVAENSDTFAASAAADGHTYGEPKWYWNDTNPEDGHTHTWKETPDGYWTKTDDGWAYTAVYTCEKDDAYQKVEGTVTKDTTEAKPGVPARPFTLPACPLTRARLRRNTRNHHPHRRHCRPALQEPCRAQGCRWQLCCYLQLGNEEGRGQAGR